LRPGGNVFVMQKAITSAHRGNSWYTSSSSVTRELKNRVPSRSPMVVIRVDNYLIEMMLGGRIS
jgi:hypothetical protein